MEGTCVHLRREGERKSTDRLFHSVRHKGIIWHSYIMGVMMKYVMAILMLVVLMVGCAPSCNTVPTQPQLPVAVDNKSTPIATVVVPLRDSKSTQTVNVIAQDVTENALKSTALIFSTNQLWADKARTNFWDEISQYQGIAGQRFGSIPNINSHYWTQGTGVIIDKNGYILTNRNNLECNAPCDKAGLEGTAPMFIYVFIFEQGSLSISPSLHWLLNKYAFME